MGYRLTSQFIMPALKPAYDPLSYDIYPSFNIGEKKIFRGIDLLEKELREKRTVIIDGYAGIYFRELRNSLDRLFSQDGSRKILWIDCSKFLKPQKEIDNMLSLSLGGDDPLFGKRTGLELEDFFYSTETRQETDSVSYSHIVYYGIGASLFADDGFLVYFDLPKNELQYRARAGSVTNIGADIPANPKTMYKRFYFADWVVLNRHKEKIISRIDIIADAQRPDDITWMGGDDFRKCLRTLAVSPFRVRPWFEPGTWGGNWIKENIPGVNTAVPNYAWSFELITPENGIIFESSGLILEFTFDFLMYAAGKNIVGDCWERFGNQFPIRFDFLDTFDGGNLSIQCHPNPEYMKENFGEDFTQEESYYILDTKDDAVVYLGFRENIEKDNFRDALVRSEKENVPVIAEDYIQTFHVSKHDLLLVPYGTVHASGRNNMVLEISTTPYIYTFKMYDWLRPDLDGKPRPLNISRAMDNLDFGRSGEKVFRELISKPLLSGEGKDWKLFSLPTHHTHLYGVMRYHFRTSVVVNTDNKCHILSLVEGRSIVVKTGLSPEMNFSFAETFIVPASAESYTMVNKGDDEAIVVIAFVK